MVEVRKKQFESLILRLLLIILKKSVFVCVYSFSCSRFSQCPELKFCLYLLYGVMHIHKVSKYMSTRTKRRKKSVLAAELELRKSQKA